MTRAEICQQYTVDAQGIIRSPGKFEGCMLYVVHYWDVFLNGFADRDNGHILGFDVTPEDKQEFPELKRRRTVRLCESDNGFVCEV